jgi:hypothetical protein
MVFSVASSNSTDNYENVSSETSSGNAFRTPNSDVIQWTTGRKISKIGAGGNVGDLIGTSVNSNPHGLIRGEHSSDMSRG